jgi:hypothetical protein
VEKVCFTGSYEFGRIDLNRVLFDKFLSDTSYINTANGDRRQFIHLFVLDLLSAIFHILRGRVEKLLRVEDRTWVTLPSLDEPDWTRNTRRMLRKNVEINDEPYSVRLIHNFDGLNMYENVLSNARAMERAFKYLHESVGANSGPLLQSPFKVSALELEEYCECAQRLVSYKSRAIEFDKNGIEIEGSESVRRLTTLATIFLPLSLSSSILAMGSRVSELHYRIYDFFGLFCVLGTLMILGYPILRWATKRKGWNLARPCSRVYILKIIIVFHLRCAGFLILVSFLVGMSKDANLGLKIPGYGMSATLGVFILAIFAHFMYAAVPIILYKEPPANNSGQDHSIPPIIIGKSLMIFFGWFLNPR